MMRTFSWCPGRGLVGGGWLGGGRLCGGRLLRMLLCVLCLWMLSGCAKAPKKPVSTVPPASFTGPRFLHGTVGSMTQLAGYQPMIVSGYSIVSGLDGTGSADVPAFLRIWIENEMRRKGVGSLRLGAGEFSPKRLLASDTTAVVLVQGLIPPGAPRGTLFDVLVTALPRTQTTSLQDGQLWTTDLAIGAQNPRLLALKTQGKARGAIFIDPYTDTFEGQRKLDFQRQGLVPGGGVVVEDRVLQLVLNNEGWVRSRMIADRINERFPADPTDRDPTANPKSDAVIRLHMPARYASNPDRLLKLIEHLYVQTGSNFEPVQAERLAQVLLEAPEHRERVTLSWEALGKTALPVIREYYGHSAPHVKLAAIEAGARLRDERVSEHLERLASDADPDVRTRVAELLVHLPRSINGIATLRKLLDDQDTDVRLAAYESLVTNNSPMISRHPFGMHEQFKFVLDLVPARRPLIYVSQGRLPRIAIFGPNTGFRTPGVARLWDNRLMLRTAEGTRAMDVFYQRPGLGTTEHRIPATVAELVSLLAHKSTSDQPQDGLDLSYSRTVAALRGLVSDGAIDADFEVRMSPLAVLIDAAQQQGVPEQRPEFDTPVDPTDEPVTDLPVRPIASDDRRDDTDNDTARPDMLTP